MNPDLFLTTFRCANPCRHQEEGASDRQGARHGDSLTSRHLSALVVPRGTLFLVETQFNRREVDTPILGCSCRLPRPSSPSRTCRRLRRGTGRSSDPVRLLCFLVLSSCPPSSRRTNQPLLTHLVLLPLLLRSVESRALFVLQDSLIRIKSFVFSKLHPSPPALAPLANGPTVNAGPSNASLLHPPPPLPIVV
jgi:hypothetical protein